MGLGVTLLSALTVLVGFTSQNVTIVFWTDAPVSPYGILLISGCSFAIIFGLALLAFSAITGDYTSLAPSDEKEERRIFASPYSGGSFRLTHMQILCSVGFLNSLNGWLIVYASPASRTPPLIQAVLQNAGVLFSVPFSKLMLGDRKAYLSSKPMAAAALILASVIVSLLPRFLSSGSGGGGGGGDDTVSGGASSIAWCLIYFLGLAPGAGYNVCQQLYFIRSGMLSPEVSGESIVRSTLRALFWSNVAQAVSYLLFFWVDLLPWFGTVSEISSFGTTTGFSLACSLGGPSLSQLIDSSKDCPSSTPIWAYAFVLSYAVSYVGAASLNRESATFNMLVLVVVTMTTAAFWLIPGTNPNPSDTPLWSVLTSLGLSITGTILWKWWENGTMPAEEQFAVADEEEGGGSKGMYAKGRRGTGQSFHGDYDAYSYSSLPLDDVGPALGGSTSAFGGWGGDGVTDTVRALVLKHQASKYAADTSSVNGPATGTRGGYTRSYD
jgi:hypothetical protein